MFMFSMLFLYIYFSLSFRIFFSGCHLRVNVNSNARYQTLLWLCRKMHNNNNNNNNDGYDNNTTTNNNLDYGWSLKLFLTGMWHSLATLPTLCAPPLPAHFVCTYRANAHGEW